MLNVLISLKVFVAEGEGGDGFLLEILFCLLSLVEQLLKENNYICMCK